SSRRHTSFSRDWSSDVCSSDLHAILPDGYDIRPRRTPRKPPCRAYQSDNAAPLPLSIVGSRGLPDGRRRMAYRYRFRAAVVYAAPLLFILIEPTDSPPHARTVFSPRNRTCRPAGMGKDRRLQG